MIDWLTKVRYDTILDLIDHVKIPFKPLALDVGCRFGDFSIILYKKGVEVVALDLFQLTDIEETKADLARINGSIHLIRADCEHLPFKPSQFDLVICSETIDYLLNPTLFLEDVSSTLKSGGKIVITTPNKMALFGLIDSIAFWSRKLYAFFKRTPSPKKVHVSLFTWKFLRHSVLHYGFTISRVKAYEGIGFCSFFLIKGGKSSGITQNNRFFRSLFIRESSLRQMLPKDVHYKWALICQREKSSLT